MKTTKTWSLQLLQQQRRPQRLRTRLQLHYTAVVVKINTAVITIAVNTKGTNTC